MTSAQKLAAHLAQAVIEIERQGQPEDARVCRQLRALVPMVENLPTDVLSEELREFASRLENLKVLEMAAQ